MKECEREKKRERQEIEEEKCMLSKWASECCVRKIEKGRFVPSLSLSNSTEEKKYQIELKIVDMTTDEKKGTQIDSFDCQMADVERKTKQGRWRNWLKVSETESERNRKGPRRRIEREGEKMNNKNKGTDERGRERSDPTGCLWHSTCMSKILFVVSLTFLRRCLSETCSELTMEKI